MIRDRRAILALLTALNFLNYIDRAVIAAVLKPMQGELGLSNFEAGLPSSAFLIGYFLVAPLFGARADKGSRKHMITIGVIVWSVGTVASGLVAGFGQLMAARAIVGVGEASFGVLAQTIIDDVTPKDRKGMALAIFFSAIPLGYALGYMIGGALTKHYGWRTAFYVVGAPGIVIALSCLLIAEPTRKLADARAKLLDGLRACIRLPLFRRAVAGYCAYTGALGAFSYWAPHFLLDRFPGTLDDETANRWFGIVLLAAGAIGTFVGGRWMDAQLRRLPAAPAGAPFDAPVRKATVNVMLRVCAIGMAIAAPFTVACFVMPSAPGFFALAFVAELGLFLSTSPISAACMHSVPEERRASGVAASIFAIHLLGDLWSTAVLGLLQDVLPVLLAMMALPLTFAATAVIWWPRRREAE
ncbi:MAG TPA: MFS transporter [Kofleriaceae bacterium]|nr:MFS transporter [Kofleriaceae bacterium]